MYNNFITNIVKIKHKKRYNMKDKLKIKLKSYDVSLLDNSVKKIIELAKMSSIKINGPIPLPVKKEIFTILRATHKYKDSREQFERITYTRLLYIINPTERSVKELSNLVLPNGISMEIKKV